MGNHPSFTRGYEFARAWHPDDPLPDVLDTEAGRRFELGLAVGMLRNSTQVRQAWEEARILAGRPHVDAVYRPAGVLDDQPLEPALDVDASTDRALGSTDLIVGHGYQMRPGKDRSR